MLDIAFRPLREGVLAMYPRHGTVEVSEVKTVAYGVHEIPVYVFRLYDGRLVTLPISRAESRGIRRLRLDEGSYRENREQRKRVRPEPTKACSKISTPTQTLSERSQANPRQNPEPAPPFRTGDHHPSIPGWVRRKDGTWGPMRR